MSAAVAVAAAAAAATRKRPLSSSADDSPDAASKRRKVTTDVATMSAAAAAAAGGSGAAATGKVVKAQPKAPSTATATATTTTTTTTTGAGKPKSSAVAPRPTAIVQAAAPPALPTPPMKSAPAAAAPRPLPSPLPFPAVDLSTLLCDAKMNGGFALMQHATRDTTTASRQAVQWLNDLEPRLMASVLISNAAEMELRLGTLSEKGGGGGGGGGAHDTAPSMRRWGDREAQASISNRIDTGSVGIQVLRAQTNASAAFHSNISLEHTVAVCKWLDAMVSRGVVITHVLTGEPIRCACVQARKTVFKFPDNVRGVITHEPRAAVASASAAAAASSTETKTPVKKSAADDDGGDPGDVIEFHIKKPIDKDLNISLLGCDTTVFDEDAASAMASSEAAATAADGAGGAMTMTSAWSNDGYDLRLAINTEVPLDTKKSSPPKIHTWENKRDKSTRRYTIGAWFVDVSYVTSIDTTTAWGGGGAGSGRGSAGGSSSSSGTASASGAAAVKASLMALLPTRSVPKTLHESEVEWNPAMMAGHTDVTAWPDDWQRKVAQEWLQLGVFLSTLGKRT